MDKAMSKIRIAMRVYAALAVLTLIFQIYVRYPVCSVAGNCAVSYAKGAVWSAVWPASWVAYLQGSGLIRK